MTLRRRILAALTAGSLALTGCPGGGAPEGEKPQGEAAGHEEGVVTLTEAAQREVGVAWVPAAERKLATELVVTGEFEANANREAHVTTRIAGRVASIAKNVGDRVNKGERLATLESVELGQAQAAYLQSLARFELVEATAQRQRALFGEDLVARKEVLAADNALRLARIELDNARNQLVLYGFDAGRIAALGRGRALDPTVALLAPISGIVVTRHLTIGELLRPEAEQPAFSLSDVSELWVDAAVFEKDLANVHAGQPATITTPAYPGKTYRGRVSLVSTALEKASRTATARVVVPNPDGRLKADMTATVRIAVGERPALAVPAGAIVRDKEEAFVFVREDATRFRKRPVEAGTAVDGWVPIARGLKAGEQVVEKGSFTLKAELTKDSFGEHEH
jgi:cobalt-zinc-cadmium efflux system membrane fusion protein